MPRRPENVFPEYHAHVYFDAQTVERARAPCQQAGALFGVKVGRVHEKLVGPHPRWSCQLSFERSQFDRLIPWLEAQRQGMTVFVHGLTGEDLKDHTTHATWLGEEVPPNPSMFGG